MNPSGAELVGRDFSVVIAAPSRARRVAIAGFAALLAAALGLTSLRTQIIDLRYRLAEEVRHERELLETRRALTVTVRRLHDPMRLRVIAEGRGFRPPDRVIDPFARGISQEGDGL